MSERRVPWDVDAYERRVRSACFVCELVDGNPAYWHHVVERDADSVVFLAKYPWLRGHLIVAPVQHREQVVIDFHEAEYLTLQRTLHRAGRALQGSSKLSVSTFSVSEVSRAIGIRTGTSCRCRQASRIANSSWLRSPKSEAGSTSERARRQLSPPISGLRCVHNCRSAACLRWCGLLAP